MHLWRHDHRDLLDMVAGIVAEHADRAKLAEELFQPLEGSDEARRRAKAEVAALFNGS